MKRTLLAGSLIIAGYLTISPTVADDYCKGVSDAIEEVTQQHQLGVPSHQIYHHINSQDLDDNQRRYVNEWANWLVNQPAVFSQPFIDELYVEVYRNCRYARSNGSIW